MILLIDNYDSFSFNLVQLIGELAAGREELRVIRNDELSVEEIMKLEPSHIVLSPGPGRPSDAGVCEALIREVVNHPIPLLRVCLGHQAICETLGGKITYAPQLMHGKQSVVKIDDTSVIFKGLPKEIPVARYHSLVADKNMIPESLQITAVDEKGEVMAVQHKTLPIYGVQFHPESIMTPQGREMIQNFMGGYDDDSRSN
ncbi:MAG: aminodeoxychorismate/anthranilate synthase component II [Roseburia sp.]|nr:aminodeoxychorismate/anthranilate synthase component II [Roseburia sp.]